MPAQITKQLALKIAKKLRATKDATRSRAHDLMVVEHNGREVVSFGIRRGSRREAGHDHIPGDLRVPMHFAKLLAQCPRSRQDYIDLLIQQGHI